MWGKDLHIVEVSGQAVCQLFADSASFDTSLFVDLVELCEKLWNTNQVESFVNDQLHAKFQNGIFAILPVQNT